MINCPTQTGGGLIERLFGVVDCHVRDITQATYANLVGPGTMFANVFTILLTLYIALIGYQMLIGRGGLRLTQMPVEALKIGLILAFTTSWATYQTVIYDFFFEGPRQLLGAVLHSSGGERDLYVAIERAYMQMTEAASTFATMAGANANVLQGGPMLGSGLLWMAAIATLLGTVGLILAAKIVLGLLLALGPVFVGLFLFDATRGFFDGWLRAVVAFAFAPLAASVFALGLVMILNPFLAELATLTAQRRFEMGAVVVIVLIVAVFMIVMSQVLRVASMVSSGYATPRSQMHRSSGGATERAAFANVAASSGMDRGAAHIIGGAGVDAASTSISRRVMTTSDHVAQPPTAAARLDQSYRRLPRPARRAEGRA